MVHLISGVAVNAMKEDTVESREGGHSKLNCQRCDKHVKTGASHLPRQPFPPVLCLSPFSVACGSYRESETDSVEMDTVVSFCYVQPEAMLVDMNSADRKAGRGEDQTDPELLLSSPLFSPWGNHKLRLMRSSILLNRPQLSRSDPSTHLNSRKYWVLLKALWLENPRF